MIVLFRIFTSSFYINSYDGVSKSSIIIVHLLSSFNFANFSSCILKLWSRKQQDTVRKPTFKQSMAGHEVMLEILIFIYIKYWLHGSNNSIIMLFQAQAVILYYNKNSFIRRICRHFPNKIALGLLNEILYRKLS